MECRNQRSSSRRRRAAAQLIQRLRHAVQAHARAARAHRALRRGELPLSARLQASQQRPYCRCRGTIHRAHGSFAAPVLDKALSSLITKSVYSISPRPTRRKRSPRETRETDRRASSIRERRARRRAPLPPPASRAPPRARPRAVSSPNTSAIAVACPGRGAGGTGPRAGPARPGTRRCSSTPVARPTRFVGPAAPANNRSRRRSRRRPSRRRGGAPRRGSCERPRGGAQRARGGLEAWPRDHFRVLERRLELQWRASPWPRQPRRRARRFALSLATAASMTSYRRSRALVASTSRSLEEGTPLDLPRLEADIHGDLPGIAHGELAGDLAMPTLELRSRPRTGRGTAGTAWC